MKERQVAQRLLPGSAVHRPMGAASRDERVARALHQDSPHDVCVREVTTDGPTPNLELQVQDHTISGGRSAGLKHGPAVSPTGASGITASCPLIAQSAVWSHCLTPSPGSRTKLNTGTATPEGVAVATLSLRAALSSNRMSATFAVAVRPGHSRL